MLHQNDSQDLLKIIATCVTLLIVASTKFGLLIKKIKVILIEPFCTWVI